MTGRIIVEYSGWISLSPETKFIHYEDDITITAEQFAKLPEDERDDYVLESFGDACNSAIDGEYDILDITVEPEDN